MRRFTKFLASVLYYCLAKYLPASTSGLSLGIGKPFRAILCRHMFIHCGRNINVERGAVFGYNVKSNIKRGALFRYNIKIGSNSQIGVNAHLNSSGGITIGENIMMGPDVIILTRSHKHDDICVPMRYQGSYMAPVTIEDDVWIGTRVIILPGVSIGRSSIIGAGAVVTKDVPSYSIVAGNPARVVRKRK